MNQLKKIKNALNKSIKAVCQSSREYCRNPEKDFTRRKKLPMDKVIKSVLGFSSKSLANELTDIFSGDTSIASVSALVQQRTKILPTAFEEVFKQFTNTMNPVKQFEGYRLLAVDGSDIHTPTNPDDYDSYFKVKNCSPYNLYHLNALYDLCSNTYLDAVIQKTRKCNEHRALCDMVDRYNSPVPSVFIADRGYESYNNMAHIQQIGQFFLFRIKDINGHGILRGFDLPESDEFDLHVSLTLTNKQNKITKTLCKDRNHFRFTPSNSTFDFLPAYSMRWGIETSFRSLKYSLGLLYFHSKKPEFILQEIFAKLTMYNFSQLIAASVSIRKASKKLIYRINFSAATNVCRKFFLSLCTPDFVEAVIQKNILPIRSLKGKPRSLKSKPAVSFLYRVA